MSKAKKATTTRDRKPRVIIDEKKSPATRSAFILDCVMDLQRDIDAVLWAVRGVVTGGDKETSLEEWHQEVQKQWGHLLAGISTVITFEMGSEPEVWARFVDECRETWIEFFGGHDKPKEPIPTRPADSVLPYLASASGR